jgi:hypothetical protein
LVVDRDTVSIAARFDSGFNFLQMFGLSGGMPTRISLPRQRLPHIFAILGAEPSEFLALVGD